MVDTPIQHVSDTAFMVAAYRAIESEQQNPLFRDPFAARLSGERGRKIIDALPKKAFIGGWSVIIRTHIIDEFIQSALAEGIDTILNLGAGLDARPYRMELPTTLRWVEVDYPDVIEYKEKQLSGEKPHCQLTRIKLDLADISARRKFLNEITASSKKVLILTEGVIPYLAEDAVALLGSDLQTQSAIRYWIADYFSEASYRYRQKTGMSRAMKNAPFLFEPKDYFGVFSQAGWKPKEIRYFAEEAKRLNRPAPFPLSIRILTRILELLAPPERRKEMQRYAGFVLFEPKR